MRPEPLSGVGSLLRLLRARCGSEVRRVCVPALCFLYRAVLMLGIRPDCLRSEPRL